MDEELRRSTIRSVIWHLMPLLLLAYLINYIDRINIGFAGAALRKEFALSNTLFGFASGLFFWGYFLFEVPSNLILARVGARRWIARIMVSWGILSACMVFVRGPWSFCVLRFLLGLAEAGFFPGIIYYLVCWFPTAYRARMMGLFSIGIPLSTVIGAPLSGVFLGMTGIAGLQGWQWMFLMEGVPAALFGIVIFLRLPDRPADAHWLSPDQKQWLEQALAADPNRPTLSHWLDTAGSLLRPSVLALAFIYLANTAANLSLAFFLPQIIATMGTMPMQTMLLTTIPSAIGAVGLLVVGWLSDRLANPRALLLTALLITCAGLLGAAVFGAGGASAIGIAALSFGAIGIYGLKAPFWALAPMSLAATTAAGGIAWINSVGNLGGYFGPQVMGFLADHFGGFRAGMFALAAFQVAAMLAMLILRRPAAAP